jgi:hypothetical protein
MRRTHLYSSLFPRSASETEEAAPQKRASVPVGEADLTPPGPTLTLTKQALRLDEYAPRKPRRSRMLQQVLFA